MQIALRLIQLLLGLAFIVAGFSKLAMPAAMLARQVPPWITSYQPPAVRAFGVAELAGGVAVLVPAVLSVDPRIAAAGASGLALIMAAAIVTHLVRGDLRNIPANAFLLILCALVVWGRSGTR